MNCEEIRENLEAYILSALDADTSTIVAKHLHECEDCRRLADEYAEIISHLPQAVAAVSLLSMPDLLKARVMATIETSQVSKAVEKFSVREYTTPTRRSISITGARLQQFGALTVLVLLISSGVWIAHLNTALAHEQSLRESLEAQTELIFEVVDSDQTTRHFLRATENAPALPNAAPPYGKVFVRDDLPYVISMTGRLPQAPAGQVYNLWLFRDGSTELAGTLTPDDAGFGTLVYEVNENGPLYEAAQLVLQAVNSADPSGVVVLSWEPN